MQKWELFRKFPFLHLKLSTLCRQLEMRPPGRRFPLQASPRLRFVSPSGGEAGSARSPASAEPDEGARCILHFRPVFALSPFRRRGGGPGSPPALCFPRSADHWSAAVQAAPSAHPWRIRTQAPSPSPPFTLHCSLPRRHPGQIHSQPPHPRHCEPVSQHWRGNPFSLSSPERGGVAARPPPSP